MLKKYRKFVTSSVGFTFLFVGVTGVIFKLFFKNHVLEEIHGWLGLAMFVAALLHIQHNWTAIRNYLGDARVLALTIPIFLVVAFLVFQPKEERGFNPKQVMRRLSGGNIVDLAKVFGKDGTEVLAAMRADGIKVEDGAKSLEEVAKNNDRSPDGLFAYFLK